MNGEHMKKMMSIAILTVLFMVTVSGVAHATWWNPNWGKSKAFNLTCRTPGDCTYEPVIIPVHNDSAINTSAGYPNAIRLVGNKSGVLFEVPYDLVNITEDTRSAGVLALFNSTSAGSQFHIYYDSAGASAPNYSDCSTWKPCWDNASFFRMYDGFEDGNLVDGWQIAAGSPAVSNVQKKEGNYAALFHTANERMYNKFNNASYLYIEYWTYTGTANQGNNTEFRLADGGDVQNGALTSNGNPTQGNWGYYNGAWINTGTTHRSGLWDKHRFQVNDTANRWQWFLNNATLTSEVNFQLGANNFNTINWQTKSNFTDNWYIDELYISKNNFNTYYNKSSFNGFGPQENSNSTNETDARIAIERAINNSLPSPTKFTDRQIYTRDSGNLQKTAKFDIIAIYGTQRWAFKYVTIGEVATNITSLGTTLNIWQNQSLDNTQIETSASTFINTTKN